MSDSTRSKLYSWALKELAERYPEELRAAIEVEAADPEPGAAGVLYYARATVRDAHYEEFTEIYARHLEAMGLSPPGGQHKAAEEPEQPEPATLEAELGGFVPPTKWALFRETADQLTEGRKDLARARTTITRLGAKLGHTENELWHVTRQAGELQRVNAELQRAVDSALTREAIARRAGYQALAATAFAASYQLGEDWLSRELTVPAELVKYAERGELVVHLSVARDGAWVLTAELFPHAVLPGLVVHLHPIRAPAGLPG